MTPRGLILWEAPRAEPISARIAIGGDFLPAGKLSLPAGGWRDAARGLSAHFADVAMSFVNLECALDAETLPARPLSGIGTIVSAPADSLDFLAAIESSAVCIANNHIFDFGHAGAVRTRQTLTHRGIVPLGAGGTLRGTPEVFVWQGPGNVRVGFWAAASACRDLATRKSPGVEPATVARALQALTTMKSHGAKLAVALLHAGCLRTSRPDPADVERMDAIARCGFDLVAASHSHRISGAKLLANSDRSPSFCFYGLGSVASGYVASPLEREGLIVVAGLNSRGHLARIEVRPVWLAKTGFGKVPSPETAASQ